MIEKDVKEKEHSEEIDPKLKELIEIMKLIQKEMPNAEKEERITVFLEYTRERRNSYVDTEKQNMNSLNPVNIESLLNSLSFKQSKNGKSEFANIEKDLGARLSQRFTVGEYEYFNKGDVLIRVKNQKH
jgi:hypothetical protein